MKPPLDDLRTISSPSLAETTIRPLKDSELPLVLQWAIREDWNPGPYDAAVFNAADPGALIALEFQGTPVGLISSARLNEDHGFVGFFMLSPEYRHTRFGWRLLHANLERMEGLVMGSETIFELVRTYARYGLKPYYNTTSYQGVAPSHPRKWSLGVEFATTTTPDELIAYDATSTGVVREAYLREWFRIPRSLVVVFRRAGRLCGIGMARQCHRGVRIGPLQADDPAAAEALFDALVGLAPGEPVEIDCPEINPDGPKLARAKGLVACSQTSRLYRGKPPDGRLERVYGLVSFSLG